MLKAGLALVTYVHTRAGYTYTYVRVFFNERAPVRWARSYTTDKVYFIF